MRQAGLCINEPTARCSIPKIVWKTRGRVRAITRSVRMVMPMVSLAATSSVVITERSTPVCSRHSRFCDQYSVQFMEQTNRAQSVLTYQLYLSLSCCSDCSSTQELHGMGCVNTCPVRVICCTHACHSTYIPAHVYARRTACSCGELLHVLSLISHLAAGVSGLQLASALLHIMSQTYMAQLASCCKFRSATACRCATLLENVDMRADCLLSPMHRTSCGCCHAGQICYVGHGHGPDARLQMMPCLQSNDQAKTCRMI